MLENRVFSRSPRRVGAMALSGNTLDIYNEARMPALNPGETRVIGKLGGLAVQIRRQLFDGRQPGVELPGQTLHEAELSDNPLGVDLVAGKPASPDGRTA